jgi:hypothetical protein
MANNTPAFIPIYSFNGVQYINILRQTVTGETTGYMLAIQNCNRYNRSQKTYP